jgi:hypothetical protein
LSDWGSGDGFCRDYTGPIFQLNSLIVLFPDADSCILNSYYSISEVCTRFSKLSGNRFSGVGKSVVETNFLVLL